MFSPLINARFIWVTRRFLIQPVRVSVALCAQQSSIDRLFSDSQPLCNLPIAPAVAVFQQQNLGVGAG